MQCGSAYLRGGKIFIQAYSQTRVGVWISSGPVYVTSGDASHAEIGEKILAALANSIVGVMHPSQNEWKFVRSPMLTAAGVKSWSSFAKGSKAVGFEYAGEMVVFTPSSNYENDGGESLPEMAIQRSKGCDELGAALSQAFAACDGPG